MTRLELGVACGLVFGAAAVAMMLPMRFPDKRTALLAAFFDRFAIGLVVALAPLPLPAWLAGAGWGLLLSAPSALITRAWAPILGMGALGGLLCGLAVAHFGGAV